MITLHRPEDCCGCSACASVCPVKCITMNRDRDGFEYPETDLQACIDCHLCECICPTINAPRRGGNIPVLPSEPRLPAPRVLEMRSRNAAIVEKSSNGGIFTLLAEQTVARGGVVFGARWSDDFSEVVHDFAENLDDLAAFRGSKYVQSKTGNCFKKARELLLAGREVLFTGTPCEIAGLKRSLRRDFPKLLAVDVACEKVGSPRVWREFLDKKLAEIAFPREQISAILHRKKSVKNGIPASDDFAIESAAGTVFQAPFAGTAFGELFESGAISRPSCVECPAKPLFASGSDLTLNDSPDGTAGTSLVQIHSARGNAAIDAILPLCDIARERVVSAIGFEIKK